MVYVSKYLKKREQYEFFFETPAKTDWFKNKCRQSFKVGYFPVGQLSQWCLFGFSIGFKKISAF
jgi:hypothetical protein